jgi:hypothetical protein
VEAVHAEDTELEGLLAGDVLEKSLALSQVRTVPPSVVLVLIWSWNPPT